MGMYFRHVLRRADRM